MSSDWMKRIGGLAVLVAVVAGFYFSLKQKPVLVDLAEVTRESMSVTINEEGIAQVKDVYTLSSPIAGHLSRTTLEEGDVVAAHTTVVASIHPLEPPFLDARTRHQLEASLEAARSAVALANVERDRVMTALTLATSEYNRAVKLNRSSSISESAMERTYSELQLEKAQLDSAEASIQLREAEVESVEARLEQPRDLNADPVEGDCCLHITSPVDGIVLRMFTRSEQALSVGSQIAEVGDPTTMEIIVDLLSSDAVRIREGATATISDWGGEGELEATVKRIDPAAFTKVSALGIEEQRVNVVLDLHNRPEGLGHGFRVFARMRIWEAPSVLQVPLGALFRAGGQWAVFNLENGLAKIQKVEIGHLNSKSAEIVNGIAEGASVVLYPNDLIADGTPVEDRQGA